MRKTTLKNGLTIITEAKPADSVSIVATVKVGSNNEAKKIRGISHFIEHMLFEGTQHRKSSTIIATEIEKLGGDLNAYTSNERTAFFIKVPKKHFDVALDIISDLIQNPLFDKNSIEKERKIILKEINMVTDEPRFHQWVLFQKTLFKKCNAKTPAYGTIEAVKSITRNDLINYYKKYYIPNNMIISVVGDIKNIHKKIEKSFKNFKKGREIKIKTVKEPAQKSIQKKIEKKKILNSYMVLGYKTARRDEKDSYVLDVVKAILGRGQSGKIIEEIRNKRGLAYEVNVLHDSNKEYGLFAVYLNTDKKNINNVIGIILDEFNKLKKIKEKEINDAKGFIEGQFILDKEDTIHLADLTSFWEMIKDASLAKNYIKEIKKITKKDISKVANKYLTKKYTLAVIMQS